MCAHEAAIKLVPAKGFPRRSGVQRLPIKARHRATKPLCKGDVTQDDF